MIEHWLNHFNFYFALATPKPVRKQITSIKMITQSEPLHDEVLSDIITRKMYTCDFIVLGGAWILYKKMKPTRLAQKGDHWICNPVVACSDIGRDKLLSDNRSEAFSLMVICLSPLIKK